MCALYGDRPDLVSLLLACGADVTPRSNQVVPTRPTHVRHAASSVISHQAAPAAPLTTVIVYSGLETVGGLIHMQLPRKVYRPLWSCRL